MRDYQKQQDLIFQQIEEKQRLSNQSWDATVAEILNSKETRALARAWDISVEECQKILERMIRERREQL